MREIELVLVGVKAGLDNIDIEIPNGERRKINIITAFLLKREVSNFQKTLTLTSFFHFFFLYGSDQDKPPQFFCVLRLTSKAPNMIIRLGFLGGTPACIRLAEIEVLREKIRNLSFPHRGTQKVSSRIPHSTSADSIEEAKRHKSPLSREGSEIACCVLLTKPVEKILVMWVWCEWNFIFKSIQRKLFLYYENIISYVLDWNHFCDVSML